jgi:polyisoprenoid-binding protein YceI
MRRLSLVLAILVLIGTVGMAQEKQVDTQKSKITWLGKKVTGEHTGHINFKSGQLMFKDGKLDGGNFTVDMTSITCTDIENKEYNKKLVGHLSSDDFFSVATYPESKLSLKMIKADGNGYKVKGHLTIKGKTHPLEFNVKEESGKYKGVMVIDRTLYDVRYGSGKFFDNLGDKLIYDNFELAFEVALK